MTELTQPSHIKSSQGLKTGLVLLFVSMTCLTLIHEPIGMSYFAWICLVPWVLAVTRTQKPKTMTLCNYLFGVVYYLINLIWLWPVTGPGMIALCFYLAMYFPLCGYLLHRIYHYRLWSFTIVLPIIWVGQEMLRSWVMTGFPWFYLSHSQHEHTTLIQISDLFGAYGLTFLIAMANGFFCDILLRPMGKNKKANLLAFRPLRMMTILVLLLVGTYVYGLFRIKQTPSVVTEGPIVSVIQDNIPQFVKDDATERPNILLRHLNLSRDALDKTIKPDLIVWPETMIGAINREYLALPKEPADQQDSLRIVNALTELSKNKTSILVGSNSYELQDDFTFRLFNSAELFLKDGTRWHSRYDKMHLVPFGEFIPFRESWPAFYKFLNSVLSPYEGFEYSLTAGTDPTIFEIPAQNNRTYTFSVAICYEDVIPYVPRVLTRAENKRKPVDFLLNISNEGWYVFGGGDNPIKPTGELLQHWAMCKFRAVENRVPIARSVNMGISGFIHSDGTVSTRPLAGTLPTKIRNRQAVAGFQTDRLRIDSRITLYNRIGDVFAIGCAIIMGLLLLDILAGTMILKRTPK